MPFNTKEKRNQWRRADYKLKQQLLKDAKIFKGIPLDKRKKPKPNCDA